MNALHNHTALTCQYGDALITVAIGTHGFVNVGIKHVVDGTDTVVPESPAFWLKTIAENVPQLRIVLDENAKPVDAYFVADPDAQTTPRMRFVPVPEPEAASKVKATKKDRNVATPRLPIHKKTYPTTYPKTHPTKAQTPRNQRPCDAVTCHKCGYEYEAGEVKFDTCTTWRSRCKPGNTCYDKNA